MKALPTALLLGALAAAPVAYADSMSVNQFTPKVLPVLVQVDSQGQVRQVSPSVELSPQYDRLLRQNLDQMINQPAKDHGRPVASQFVINLGLQTTARPDGKYDAHFVYVSASPVPAGSWYWVHIDGHRLALANRNEIPMRPHYYRMPDNHWWPEPLRSPAVQNAQQATPARPPVRPPRHP
jgi:hypothetical protein